MESYAMVMRLMLQVQRPWGKMATCISLPRKLRSLLRENCLFLEVKMGVHSGGDRAVVRVVAREVSEVLPQVRAD
jgi:hypothetical protein